jgi:hypothetical protein
MLDEQSLLTHWLKAQILGWYNQLLLVLAQQQVNLAGIRQLRQAEAQHIDHRISLIGAYQQRKDMRSGAAQNMQLGRQIIIGAEHPCPPAQAGPSRRQRECPGS